LPSALHTEQRQQNSKFLNLWQFQPVVISHYGFIDWHPSFVILSADCSV